MDDSCNLLSPTAFQNKYDIKVQPLTFFGITSAVNRLRRLLQGLTISTKVSCQNYLIPKSPLDLLIKSWYQKKVNIQFHVKKNGRRIQLQTLMKVLIGKRLIKYPLNVPRALKLSI